MAVPVYSELETLALEDLQANVATDPPVATGVTNQLGRALNDAYSLIWEASGGRVKKVASATAWDAAQKTTGTALGLLTDVGDILHVFATTSAPSVVLNCTATGTALATSASFAGLVGGMAVSGSGVTAGTFISSIASTTALTLNQAATSSGVTLTFSPVESSIELKKVELSRIHWRRTNSGMGTYAIPKEYAAVRQASPGTTDVNKLVLEYWPGTTAYYFPIHYVPQFVPMDATITTPDVNDLEARDIAHLAALNLAPLIGRAKLASGISLKLSEGTLAALERKLKAELDGKQSSAYAR